MAVEDIPIILARLEGILQGFAWFNEKRDHFCTFTVHQIPKAADIPTALASYFKAQPKDFGVGLLPDVERELREVFARYMFLFRHRGGNEGGDYLVDPRQSFLLMTESGQDEVLDELAVVVRSLGIRHAWRVEVRLGCDVLREGCFQNDVLLELPERLCLLHFGVSD